MSVRNRLLVFVAGLSIAATVTATGSGAATPKPSHLTAQQIATKLASLGCVATRFTGNSVSVGDIKPKVELDCTVNGESVSIQQYRNPEQVAFNMHLAKGIGCQIAKGFGETGDQDYILGGTTMTKADTATTTEQIRKAIGNGVKISVVHCG
jgi:hypothetical protein